MALAILTDSASNLTRELLEKYDIDMISFNYLHNGANEKCYNPDVSYEEAGKKFYDGLRNGEVYKTSLVSPSDYMELFKKHLDQGEDILYFAMSSGLSGTYNCSVTVKDMLKEDYPDRRIECFDCQSASFGEGIYPMRASELRGEGKSIDEIVDELSKIRMNIRNEFTVDDMTYLSRGGRFSSIAFGIGKMLNFKPLLKASTKGTIQFAGVAHGRKKAFLKMVESVKANILYPEKQTLFIAHCDVYEDAKALADKIKEAVPTLKDIYISMYDFCTGSHVGPGTIALFYYGKERVD